MNKWFYVTSTATGSRLGPFYAQSEAFVLSRLARMAGYSTLAQAGVRDMRWDYDFKVVQDADVHERDSPRRIDSFRFLASGMYFRLSWNLYHALRVFLHHSRSPYQRD